MTKIWLVVGVPCSGKSWVCEQLTSQFDYVRHDDYIAGSHGPAAYLAAIRARAPAATKPLLIETPFSMSQIVEPLKQSYFDVTPVFVIESPSILVKRYAARQSDPYPKGHLSRQETYRHRAIDGNYFQGTSAEVLQHLRQVVPARMPWETT